MTSRDFPPPPCTHPTGHHMIPITNPDTNLKTWRCVHCPAVRPLGNPTIHAREDTA